MVCREIRQKLIYVVLALCVCLSVCECERGCSHLFVCVVRQATVQQHWLSVPSPSALTDHGESADGPLHPSLEAQCPEQTHTYPYNIYTHHPQHPNKHINTTHRLKLQRCDVSVHTASPAHYSHLIQGTRRHTQTVCEAEAHVQSCKTKQSLADKSSCSNKTLFHLFLSFFLFLFPVPCLMGIAVLNVVF